MNGTLVPECPVSATSGQIAITLMAEAIPPGGGMKVGRSNPSEIQFDRQQC